MTGELFLVLVKESEHHEGRVGITVSGRVGNAVVRNRIRRWVREHVRRDLGALPPADVVIVARQSAGVASHPAVDQDLRTLLVRARGMA